MRVKSGSNSSIYTHTLLSEWYIWCFGNTDVRSNSIYCIFKKVTRHGLGELLDHLMPEHHVFNKNVELNTDENVSQTHQNHVCRKHAGRAVSAHKWVKRTSKTDGPVIYTRCFPVVAVKCLRIDHDGFK